MKLSNYKDKLASGFIICLLSLGGMDSLFNLMSKPWLGTVLGVIGLCAAVFFFLRSRVVTKLSMQYDGVKLIGSFGAAFPGEISVLFEGVEVPRVTTERFVIWNSGNSTISGDRIVSSDRLRLEASPGATILKTTLIASARDVNGVSVSSPDTGNSVACITFDFLDPKDGAIIEVLHSGALGDMDLCGTIKGLPSGIDRQGRTDLYFDDLDKHYSSKAKRKYFIFCVAAILGLLMIGYGSMRPYIYQIAPGLFSLYTITFSTDYSTPNLFYVVMGIVYILMPAQALWKKRKRYPASLLCKRGTERAVV